ncbi:hypothetical protein GQ44DRAFT_706781 [Phaeosphaeriaceae sp. PMI808]|nr:hypothetical protein GQ44DRAFT_706781 [Phaeosphaeriaceae sp. PMI808]
MKVKDESSRASSSTDDTRETRSSETSSHRYLQREPKVPGKIVPVDSPLQSQYGSPRIVTSDWGSNRSERTASIAESSSGQSHRYSIQRQSIEASSNATTPVSQDQYHLDSLRGRSRISYISTATSLSGPGTRNTSRESSPAPQSPFQEGFPTPIESEPRSAMSLKSFHMNPSNSVTSRRRSMQPLPVTNEHFVPSVDKSSPPQRHSLYGPSSPTMTDMSQPGAVESILPIDLSTRKQMADLAGSPSVPIHGISEPIGSQALTNLSSQALAPIQSQAPEGSPVRFNTRTYSIPPRRNVVSPPPRDPAPLPPNSASRQSVIGDSSIMSTQSTSPYSPTPDTRAQRRISANPKPFLRPFPVRPQQQHADQLNFIPRRMSSLTPTSGPAPLRMSIHASRSVTAPVGPQRMSAYMGPTSHPQTFQSSQQRRPTSVQARTTPAPFLLSSARPVRPVASTPSFVPSRRTSNSPDLPLNTHSALQSSISSSALREHGRAQGHQKFVAPRRSMPAIGLPPPVPPPNLPLPTLPRNITSPSLTPTSPSPSHMPLPGPPPTAPLPSIPPQMHASKGVPV